MTTTEKNLELVYNSGVSDVDALVKCDDRVMWMYYNPDAAAGGQLVCQFLNKHQIADEWKDAVNAEEFLTHLMEVANTCLIDVDSEDFEKEYKVFIMDAKNENTLFWGDYEKKKAEFLFALLKFAFEN